MKKIKQLIIIVIILINIPILANAATPIAGEKLQVKVADKNLEDYLEDDGDGDGDSESSDVEDNSYDKSKTAYAKALKKGAEAAKDMTESDFLELFKVVDADGDGILSKEELRNTGGEALGKLANMSPTILANSPRNMKLYNDSLQNINEVWSEKKEEFGVELDEETTAEKMAKERESSVYQQPVLNKDESTDSLDDMMKDADAFLAKGEQTIIENNDLQNFSSKMFNIFSIVGAAVALIVGIVIGIKYMTAGIEEKANYKQMLVPYLVGCVVVFAGFGIWALVINILNAM